jgi:hypothetical protein
MYDDHNHDVPTKTPETVHFSQIEPLSNIQFGNNDSKPGLPHDAQQRLTVA